MIHIIFDVKVNLGFVDLQLLIIDFETSKNCDKFVANCCKFLFLNKYLWLQNIGEEGLLGNKELNFINFSSTYDKSKRIHKNVTNQLFEVGFRKK